MFLLHKNTGNNVHISDNKSYSWHNNGLLFFNINLISYSVSSEQPVLHVACSIFSCCCQRYLTFPPECKQATQAED